MVHVELRFQMPPAWKKANEKKNPRKLKFETVTDVNRYPIYWRRNTGHTDLVHGIELDNRWVVPHNLYLSTKYDVHINVEVCNNIRAVGIEGFFKISYQANTNNPCIKSWVCDGINMCMWSLIFAGMYSKQWYQYHSCKVLNFLLKFVFILGL
jgi:hypothetical protein